MHSAKWSTKELTILKKHYYNMPRKELQKLIPGRSWHSIGNQASKLGLERILETSWTKEELKKLKEVYGNVSKKDAVKMFPGRTWQAIKCKAVSLGYFRLVDKKWWTTAEDKILKKIYPTGKRQEIQMAFPERTWKAIQNRAITIEAYRTQPSGNHAYTIAELKLIRECIDKGIDAHTVIAAGLIKNRHPDAIKEKFHYESKRQEM